MHLLCHFETKNYGDWKSDFDGDMEKRMNAGLTLMQMWQGVDEPAQVTCLFEANDRARAEDWLKTEQGFGQAITSYFLRTV